MGEARGCSFVHCFSSPFCAGRMCLDGGKRSNTRWGWIAVMQAWAESFYTSVAWRRCRKAYIAKAGGLCERCLAKGVYRAGVIVHHKVHLTPQNINDPSISCCFDNLELLCRDCHAEEHSRTEKRYMIDDAGRVIPHIPPMEVGI